MKTIDKRVARNTRSVKGLIDLLNGVIKSPSDFSNDLLLCAALKSQGALSKYNNEKYNIYLSSINTLKRTSEKFIDGGFEYLDKLRASALLCMENIYHAQNREKKITRSSMKQRIIDLESESIELQQELLLLSYLLEKSMKQSRNYADQSADNIVRTLCEKEQREIRSYLSLTHNKKDFKGKVRILENE